MNFFEAELKTEREEQENYADLRPLADGLSAGNDFYEPQMRTDDEAGYDVSQDEGLFERPGDDGENSGGN